jgi:hypothetical protein
MVVGAGVAGMKFAEIAAQRGHRVDLFEKEENLGGQINILKNIPFRNEFSEVTRFLEYEIKQLKNITIHTATAVDAKTVQKMKPDVLVVATGAVALLPELVRKTKGVTTWDVLEDRVDIGKNVLVYDPLSFNEGPGIVEYLFDTYENIKIHYVTPESDIAMNAKNENKDILLRRLLPQALKITPYMALIQADDEKLTFQKVYTDKKMTIKTDKFDNLIYAGLQKSVDDLFWKFETDGIKEVYRIGDAKAPSCVEISIRDAELLAREV